MKDEYLFLWAQWGIFNLQQLQFMLKKFGSFEEGWKNISPDFLAIVGFKSKKVQRAFEVKKCLSFESIMDTVRHFDIKLYYIEDHDYPKLLKELETPPPFIWVRGNLPSFTKSISVVGTRAHTAYGRVTAEKFTADLVRHDFVIVSGMALGIDSISHRETLRGNGVTVAVFGTGVDIIYPHSNHRLAQEILHGRGALISSYPLGTPAMPHHFRERNLIVAGLSRATLVIEGGVKSGALITARLALQSNREVFAVPTSITNYALSGSNNLIRRGEAKLVENINHVLEDFNMKLKTMREAHDFDRDELTILEKLAHGGKNIDILCNETEFDIPRLSELLVYLSLKKAVLRQGERWVLN